MKKEPDKTLNIILKCTNQDIFQKKYTKSIAQKKALRNFFEAVIKYQ